MDDKDIEILKHLSVDGRQSARQLSHRLGVSTVTILSRIKKLEEQNIIQGYSVRLNHELLGFDITALIEINPWFIRSNRRPGVATKISIPLLIALVWPC